MSTIAADPVRHLAGTFMMLASAVVFSLAGIWTKMISTDIWTILCWRGLVGGLVILAYVAYKDRHLAFWTRFKPGWRGWIVAIVGGLASMAFIAAFKMTFIANVVLIYATMPFMAAGIAYLVSRERMKRRTFLSTSASLVGVAFVVSGGIGTGHLQGDVAALLMTIGCAVLMVLIRKFRDAPMVLAGGISSILVFIVGWFMGDPLHVSADDMTLLVLFGATFALASILWTEGSRLIPSSEAAFIGLSETPIAIVFAWLILSEIPPINSMIGGAIVMTAVSLHTLWEMRREMRQGIRRTRG